MSNILSLFTKMVEKYGGVPIHLCANSVVPVWTLFFGIGSGSSLFSKVVLMQPLCA